MKPAVVGTCDLASSSLHPGRLLPTRPSKECQVCRSEALPTSAFSTATHWSVSRWMDENSALEGGLRCNQAEGLAFSGAARFYVTLHRLVQPGPGGWMKPRVRKRQDSNQTRRALSDSFINPDRAATQGWVWGLLSHTYQPEKDPAIRR